MESSGQQQHQNQSNDDVLAATLEANSTTNDGQQQQQRRRPRPDQMDAHSVWGSVTQSQRSFKIYEAKNHYFGDDVSVATSVQQPQPLASTKWMDGGDTGTNTTSGTPSAQEDDSEHRRLAEEYDVPEDFDYLREELDPGFGAANANGAATLDANGNSLPHPDAVRSTNVANKKADLGLDANLGGNGNSLPHPETLMRDSKAAAATISTGKGSDNDDAILDVNGNSLPHPDTMRSTKATSKKVDQDVDTILGGNGNSLPHPETLMRGSNTAATTVNTGNDSDNDDAILDVNGNSLPHPDTMWFSNITNRNESMDALNENGNSLPHPEALRGIGADILLADLEGTAAESDSTDDSSDDDSSSESNISNGEDCLDDNGNSLPHPDTMLASAANSQNSSSSLFGNLRRSVMSSLPGMKKPFNAKAPVSSLHSNAENPREEQNNFEKDPFMDTTYGVDEENGLNLQTGSTFHGPKNGSVMAYEVDYFEDENCGNENVSSVPHRFNKERIQNMFQGRRFSWKWGCLIFAIFLIFLGMLTPLAMLAKERRQRIKPLPPVDTTAPVSSSSPTTSPTTTSISEKMFDINCDDEIVLVDAEGNDITDENASTNIFSDNGDTIACYTTKKPVVFRFKRCNPLPLDWVGIFPSGSMFMDKLWKPFYGGTYLCAGQPCPEVAGNTPITKTSTAPPITNPGVYRFFLVKYSDWPYEFATYAPSFRVVEDEKQCQIPLPTTGKETLPPTQLS